MPEHSVQPLGASSANPLCEEPLLQPTEKLWLLELVSTMACAVQQEHCLDGRKRCPGGALRQCHKHKHNRRALLHCYSSLYMANGLASAPAPLSGCCDNTGQHHQGMLSAACPWHEGASARVGSHLLQEKSFPFLFCQLCSVWRTSQISTFLWSTRGHLTSPVSTKKNPPVW